MAGQRQESETSWRAVSAAALAAIAAMIVTLSFHAWNARDDDEAWERLLEAAWGVDGTVGMVVLLVAAPLAALVFVARFGGDATGDALVGAGATAGVAGVGLLGSHLLARPSGVGQLVIPGDVIAVQAGITAIASILLTIVLRRRPTVRSFAATFGMVFGALGLIATAAFRDNAADPTPPWLTAALLIAIVVVGVANRPGRFEWAAIAALVVAVIALRWIMDDAVACEDDDCLPLPMSGAWLSVAAVLLGSKWWRRDNRRRARATD